MLDDPAAPALLFSPTSAWVAVYTSCSMAHTPAIWTVPRPRPLLARLEPVNFTMPFGMTSPLGAVVRSEGRRRRWR